MRGEGFSLRIPPGWVARRQGTITLLFPRDRADVSLRAHSLPRGGLSLSRMGSLAVQMLRSELPGARVSPPRASRLDGRAALAVTGRRGTLRRELTLTIAGHRGYLLDLRRSSSAPSRVLAGAVGALRSFRAAGAAGP